MAKKGESGHAGFKDHSTTIQCFHEWKLLEENLSSNENKGYHSKPLTKIIKVLVNNSLEIANSSINALTFQGSRSQKAWHAQTQPNPYRSKKFFGI